MSVYTNGYLKLFTKTAIDLVIGIRSNNIAPGDESSKVWLSNYCDIDDKWHDVSIPLVDFLSRDARLDLTRMKILFNVAVADRHILVHGAAYSIKGVRYAPTPIGEAPWTWSFPDYGEEDTLLYHRDFGLLQHMHCNTIRTWG